MNDDVEFKKKLNRKKHSRNFRIQARRLKRVKKYCNGGLYI